MVIDTSAVVAILLGEQGADVFACAINKADVILMSAASVLEVSMVIESRIGVQAAAALDQWLENSPIEIVVVTRHQVSVAREGFRRFGKGRHPAALNFGDCFSYALAKVSGEPLLFQGEDFSKTDVMPAVQRRIP
jgi:ribonuclease VapC